MPNIKISQLPAATTKLPCSELAVVVKSGIDKKVLRRGATENARCTVRHAACDTRALQHYLGHRSITHTVRYTELRSDRFDGFWKD